MTISLICACKNRNEALQIALNSWLLKKEITEIIIVDWSSDESLSSLTKLNERIKVITVPNQKYFNQPQPLNLAASIATGDYILKVDCDYVFSPYYNFFENYQIDENSFVSGKHNIKNYDYFNETTQSFVVDKDKMSFQELIEYVKSYSPIFKHLIGLLFISRQNFEKVGGYNEKLGKYYAYEDDEMFHRLRVLGLNEIKLNFDYNILHIPHPDKKRTENFEGYDSQQLNYIKDSLSDEDHKVKEWNAEYLLSQKHIEENKKIAPLTDNYYTIPLTEWNLQKIDEQNYYAHKIMKTNKLENFPSVYYVSLEESTDRQKNLERQFAEYGITPTAIISKRYSESDDEITGKFLDQMNGGTIGCAVSHIKAIRKWYEETDEEYAFFCEDDLSLETIQYWDFTWEEFIETIPEGSLYVQLLLIRDNYETFEIRKKLWDDWSATAYILTREYAKLLIDSYCLGEKKFHLEIPGVNNYAVPLVENILFETIDKGGAAVPLFVEDVNFSTTFSPEEDNEVVNNQKGGHYEARETVLNYWKNKMKSFKITKQEEPKDFKMNQIEYLLSEYANDSENAENNLKLGAWYWNQKHSAPALSYFLRCAERAEDPTLAYEALLWSHLCYEIQGTRDATARTLLQHAIHELPNRPEAYYLLAKFHSKREQWTDTYIVATQGLTLTEKDLPPLRNDIGYVGEYALLYEKAVSGWWWGKNIESGLIFKDLHENHRMQEEYRNKVLDNLQKYFPNLLVPPNFDWGNTDPEYVEMFSKENFIERTYEKHCQVKLGDVVLDAGANCGSFTYSILGKKPKQIYCVEPSNTIIHSLKKNVGHGPVTFINRAISDFESDNVIIADKGVYIYGNDGNEYPTTTFKKIIEGNNITRIDFLKFDCEGGEYSIFTKENYDFIIKNVGHCAGEWHINDHKDAIEKFIEFRDLYLNKCNLLHVYERSGKEITEQIFDDNYLYGFREYWKHTYLGQFIIYFTFNNSTEGSVDVVEVSESEKMDIVLQGKYEEYTDEIIDEYLRVPFVNNVIVSCWDDDRPEHYHSSKVKYVRSVYPLSSGTCNKNLQITTSFAGIKLCKTKFSAKMRSDQKYNYNSMVNMYEFLMENHTEGKIFVAGMFPYLLFHPRDHIYWGTTENLYQLFDIPLEYNSLIDKVRIGKYELAQYTNYFTRPETYIGAHYCARFDDCVKKMLIEPEKYLYDDAINWQDAKDFSDRITPLVFKSFSRKCIDFDWTCKPGFTVQSYLDVCSWYEDDSNIN